MGFIKVYQLPSNAKHILLIDKNEIKNRKILIKEVQFFFILVLSNNFLNNAMQKQILVSILCLFIFSCNSKLFSNSKEKRTSLELIKNNLELSKSEYNKIKDKDSLIYEISLSIKKNVIPKLIKRRFDSFYLNNYSQKEFKFILELDRAFPNGDNIFEIDRSDNTDNFIKMKSIDEIKLLMKKIDSTFENKQNIKIKTKQDSTKN